MRAQNERCKRGETCHFLVRRNPNYARRRQILNALDEVEQAYAASTSSSANGTCSSSNKSFDADCSMNSLDDSSSLLDISIETLSDDLQSLMTSDEDDECASSTSGSSDTSSEGSSSIRRTPSTLTVIPKPATAELCSHCHNSYKSCDFCHNSNPSALLAHNSSSVSSKASPALPTSYSPVYNIREIRTATHSFSCLGNDKKLLEIELNGRFDPSTCRPRPQSVYMSRAVPRMILDATSATETTPAVTLMQQHDVNGNHAVVKASTITTTLGGEEVNNNPAKGLGHFVYI